MYSRTTAKPFESYGQCKQWRRKSCPTKGVRVTLGAGLCERCWDRKTEKSRGELI